MKKKPEKGSDPEIGQVFAGRCDRCGEAYEAHSKKDDLRGITFKCKKVICSGRVTLDYATADLFAKSPKEILGPRRYC